MNLWSALEILPYATFRPLLKQRVSGFFLHDVSADPPAIIRNLFRAPLPEEARAIFAFLAKEFNFVSLDQVVRHYRDGEPVPPYAAFLSIDDGYVSCRRVIAPLLKEAGIPATFFLTTCGINNAGLFGAHKRSLIIDELLRNHDANDIVPFLSPESGQVEQRSVHVVVEDLRRLPIHTNRGRATMEHLGGELGLDWRAYLDEHRPFMCEDDIHWLLDEGFDIGAHGLDHTKFQFLNETERERQVRQSVDFLCDRFGLQQVAFSFPNSASRVERDWMRRQLDANPRISIFVNTGRYQPNDATMVNRITLDRSLAEREVGVSTVPATIKTALVRSFSQ